MTEPPGVTVPVPGTCRCGRRLPLRLHLATARALTAQLRSLPSTLLTAVHLDYACPDCGALLPVTVQELLGT